MARRMGKGNHSHIPEEKKEPVDMVVLSYHKDLRGIWMPPKSLKMFDLLLIEKKKNFSSEYKLKSPCVNIKQVNVLQ